MDLGGAHHHLLKSVVAVSSNSAEIGFCLIARQ